MRHTKCELEILYRFPSKTSEILKAIKKPLKIVLSTFRLRKIYSRKSIKYWKEQREPMPLESRSVSSFIIHSAQVWLGMAEKMQHPLHQLPWEETSTCISHPTQLHVTEAKLRASIAKKLETSFLIWSPSSGGSAPGMVGKEHWGSDYPCPRSHTDHWSLDRTCRKRRLQSSNVSMHHPAPETGGHSAWFPSTAPN